MTSYNPNCLPKARPPDTIRRQSFKIWLLGNTNTQCTAGRETVKKKSSYFWGTTKTFEDARKLKISRYTSDSVFYMTLGCHSSLSQVFYYVVFYLWQTINLGILDITAKQLVRYFFSKFSLTSSFCRRQRVAIALILSSICRSTRFSRHQRDLFGGEDAPHKMHFYSENIILMDWLKSQIQTFSSKL